MIISDVASILKNFVSLTRGVTHRSTYRETKRDNHKNYNLLDCDWFKKVLFSTNSLAELLSDSLLLDSLLSDSSLSQSHSKL